MEGGNAMVAQGRPLLAGCRVFVWQCAATLLLTIETVFAADMLISSRQGRLAAASWALAFCNPPLSASICFCSGATVACKLDALFCSWMNAACLLETR